MKEAICDATNGRDWDGLLRLQRAITARCL